MVEARRIVLVTQGGGDSCLAPVLAAAGAAAVTVVAVGDLVTANHGPDGDLVVVEATDGAAAVWAAVGALRRLGTVLPVVAWLPLRDAELAVEAMRAGAENCLFGDDLDRLPAFFDRAEGGARAAPGADHDELALARTLIELSPHGFVVSDLDGVITFSNRAQDRSLGHSAGRLVGRKVWDFAPDEATALATRAEYERIVRDLPEPTPFMTRTMTTSSEVVDLLIHWSYLRDQRHAVLGLCSVLTDVTDLERTRAELCDTAERFRLLVESSPLAIVVHRDGRIVYVNRRALEMYGAEREDEVVGHPPEEFIHPDDRERLSRYTGETGAEAVAPGRETRLVCRDGRIVDIAMRSMPISYAAGKARMVLCQDVTEEKRTRTLLARRDAILDAVGFAAHRLLRPGRFMDSLGAILARLGTAAHVDAVVVRALADGDEPAPRSSVVGVWARSGSFPSGGGDAPLDWAESAFARWRAELRRGEVVAGTVRQLPEPERTALERAGLSAVIAVPVFVGGHWWGTMQYHQSNELRVWEAPEIDALGVAASALGGAIERQRAEETEALHRRQIMQADRLASLGVLVSGVAHEVNNPNQFILSNAELLHRVVLGLQPVADEYYREHGDFLLAGINYSELRSRMVTLCVHVADGARRIGSIVEALRDFAQGRSTRLDEEVDLNHVVKSALVLVGSLASRHAVDVQLDFGADVPAVRGSFQQLEQVVVNLVKNACQACEQREGHVVVCTRRRAATDQVVVTVSDDGCGIPAEHLDRVTDPFFTTRRDQGGTGLGLAVTSGIVRDHGGRVDVASTVGVGTTVTVTLPTACHDVAPGAG